MKHQPNSALTAASPRSAARATLGLLLVLLTLWLVATAALAAPSFPKLSGRVVDDAQVLPPETVAALTTKLAALEAANGTQLVVVTLPGLQGYDIGDYGYQLGRAWGIGQKGANNGALLIVAPSERKVRIEVGYGLEPVLTDALTNRIIRHDIVPRFKAGDIPGGVSAGTDALVAQLQLPPEAAKAAAAKAKAADSGPGFSPIALFWLALIIIWIIVAIKRSKRGRRMAGSSAPVVIWGPGTGGWGRDHGRSNGWGGGGWGGGGGGWGGGGFGGGGGGFGGGGSSGSW